MTHESRGAVVVTGASSGFGARTAQVLAEEGHPVVAVARRADRMESLVSHDPELKIWPMVADVRDADALEKAFEELPEEYRNVSALVNNAGLSKGLEPIQSGDRGLWREMVETNIMGLLNVTDLILPRLVARNAGHIVNVGSITATYPYLGGNVYGATKAFVHRADPEHARRPARDRSAGELRRAGDGEDGVRAGSLRRRRRPGGSSLRRPRTPVGG